MAYMNTRLHRRGIATIEMALVMPLLLILTFGLIEYGWLFLKSQQVTNAARQGARIAARPDADNSLALASVASAMDNAGLAASGYAVTLSPGDVTSPLSGQLLTVSVNVDYENIRLLGLPFVPMPSTIAASTTMAKEGP